MESIETINENDFFEFYNSRTYTANCFNDDGSLKIASIFYLKINNFYVIIYKESNSKRYFVGLCHRSA